MDKRKDERKDGKDEQALEMVERPMGNGKDGKIGKTKRWRGEQIS